MYCFYVEVNLNMFTISRYKELLDGKSQLEEREREMKAEREAMEAQAQRRQETERELERLKEESER